jgi:hypothetical protein
VRIARGFDVRATSDCYRWSSAATNINTFRYAICDSICRCHILFGKEVSEYLRGFSEIKSWTKDELCLLSTSTRN